MTPAKFPEIKMKVDAYDELPGWCSLCKKEVV